MLFADPMTCTDSETAEQLSGQLAASASEDMGTW